MYVLVTWNICIHIYTHVYLYIINPESQGEKIRKSVKEKTDYNSVEKVSYYQYRDVPNGIKGIMKMIEMLIGRTQS